MAIQQSLAFLLLLVVFPDSAGAGLAAGGGPSSVITSTYSAVANDTHAGPAGVKEDYDHCVGMLSAYPEAASAVDLRGVAIAAADLTAANVTNMEAFLQQLIGNLQSCLETYRGMIGKVENGTQDLRAGRIDTAANKLSYASSLPMQCLLPYMYAEKQSPIDNEISATLGVASTTASIARILKSTHKL